MNLIPKYTNTIKEIREMIADECGDLSDGMIQRAIKDNLCGDDVDFYGAASDALNLLAAKYKNQFSFTSNEQRFELKQKIDNCLTLSQSFAQKSHPKSFTITRSDTWY